LHGKRWQPCSRISTVGTGRDERNMPNKEKPYSELVAQAERAVSAVKDAELRRVAFEKVLDDLLSNAGAGHSRSVSPKGGTLHEKHVAPRGKSKRGGPRAYLDELVTEEFFASPKTISAVKAELENRGHHIPLTSLSGPLQKLCQKKALRRQRVDRQKADGRVARNPSRTPTDKGQLHGVVRRLQPAISLAHTRGTRP
jgi:hypothetical protein